MRLFVLGAGYVGQAVLKLWSDRHDILWTSTTTEAKLPDLEQIADKAFVVHGMDEKKLGELIEPCDVLIICVAPVAQADYRKTYFETARHVRNLLDQRDRPLYVLYTSSTSVYGDQAGAWVDENGPRLNQTENGIILCQAEDLYLGCQNPKVIVCVLRLAGIYGPGREIEKRARAMSGRTWGGRADSPTNHVHRDDIARAIELCVRHTCSGIYNLACDDHPTRRELYEPLCKKLAIAPPIWDPSVSSEHGSHIRVSNEKIKRAGFTFEQALK
jgi:nucleoside-diphosphate-sugar epimerase